MGVGRAVLVDEHLQGLGRIHVMGAAGAGKEGAHPVFAEAAEESQHPEARLGGTAVEGADQGRDNVFRGAAGEGTGGDGATSGTAIAAVVSLLPEALEEREEQLKLAQAHAFLGGLEEGLDDPPVLAGVHLGIEQVEEHGRAGAPERGLQSAR